MDVSGLKSNDPATREKLRNALFSAAESAYVLPPQLCLLVVSRAAPAIYETAELASMRIQRSFRSWRTLHKFTRLRDDIMAMALPGRSQPSRARSFVRHSLAPQRSDSDRF